MANGNRNESPKDAEAQEEVRTSEAEAQNQCSQTFQVPRWIDGTKCGSFTVMVLGEAMIGDQWLDCQVITDESGSYRPGQRIAQKRSTLVAAGYEDDGKFDSAMAQREDIQQVVNAAMQTLGDAVNRWSYEEVYEALGDQVTRRIEAVLKDFDYVPW